MRPAAEVMKVADGTALEGIPDHRDEVFHCCRTGPKHLHDDLRVTLSGQCSDAGSLTALHRLTT